MIPDISFADEEFYSGKKLRIINIIPKTIAKFLEIFMLISKQHHFSHSMSLYSKQPISSYIGGKNAGKMKAPTTNMKNKLIDTTALPERESYSAGKVFHLKSLVFR